MDTLRIIVQYLCFVGMVMIPVSAVTSVIVTKRAKGSEKRSTAALFFVIGSILFFVLMELAHFILSVKVYHNSEERMDTLPSFTVTSDDLHDGVWDAVITHSDGRDLSPQLSWEPVEGATAYGILMVDPDGGDWLHWKTGLVATAGVPQGYALPETYIGPYPPEGTSHTYTVYVAALRRPDPNVMGTLDWSNVDSNISVETMLSSMDVTENGRTGNVIAIGTLSGQYP